MRDITGWLLAETRGAEIDFTPASVRRSLHTDGDTLLALQDGMSWEIGWSRSTLDQRVELLAAVRSLQQDLVIASRDGPFVSDLPEDLAAIVRPAVSLCTECELQSSLV